MVKSLEAMATDGKGKMDAKASRMTEKYNAAKASMKRRFGEQPFGPVTTENYNKGIDAAVHKVDSDKWKENWVNAMKR